MVRRSNYRVSVKIHLPVYLRRYAGDASTVEVSGDTAAACLDSLAAKFPETAPMLFAAPGQLHDYVSVFLNGEFACGEGMDRKIEDGAEVHLLYVISGG